LGFWYLIYQVVESCCAHVRVVIDQLEMTYTARQLKPHRSTMSRL
jgi:hypothetical protein